MLKTVRILSKILYAASLFLAVGYCSTALYSVVLFVFKTPQFRIIEDGRRFQMLFPFSDVVFMRGENTFGQMATMVVLIGLYGLFFAFLSNIFDIFRREKWFTKQALMSLRVFSIGNIIAPIAAYLFVVAVWETESPAEMLVALHALLGVFTLFLAAIFQQGLHLQNEQDLII